MNTEELIRFYIKPRLKSPSLIASWPGVGNVSLIACSYLKKKLGFKELAEVNASHFFDPTGVTVIDSLVEAPQFPESKFYYWKNPKHGNDLILFIADDQPPVKIYEMANCIIDVAQMFGVKRIYTCAATLSRIHHTEQPRAWGVATSSDLVAELEGKGLTRKDNLHIAGLNGLLLGVTKERGIDGVCLLGEVPSYATRIENPKAALAVVKVLNNILDIEVDTQELAEIAEENEIRMRQITAEAMAEYIDHFTRPIWEFGEEEEGGEEEEE